MNHAIVIGGSIGGLLAARVLSDHYGSVTILERDLYPNAPGHRRGVPQSRHTHGLLASGRNAIEDFFPGISAELVRGGAILADPILADPILKGRWHNEGAALAQFPSGMDGILASRPLIEAAIRRRTLAIPNITVRQGASADALVCDNGAITGVRAGAETIPAGLVIDASGRASKLPQWLAALGYQPPPEDRVEISLAYTTRLFRRRPDDLNADLAVVLTPTPQGKVSGVLLAQEHDRWTCTLVGYFGRSAPADLEGFRAFSRLLPSRDIHDVISRAEPIGDAAIARYPASIRRRYEKLSRFPSGLLAVADSICTFNPAYGQGMSVASLEAQELARALRSGSAAIAPRFFSRASKVIDIPWAIVVGADLKIPETTGQRTPAIRFVNWYMARLHRAAHRDPAVALAFHEVANLLSPPPSIFHPAILSRVIWGNLVRFDPPAPGTLDTWQSNEWTMSRSSSTTSRKPSTSF